MIAVNTFEDDKMPKIPMQNARQAQQVKLFRFQPNRTPGKIEGCADLDRKSVV